MYSTCVILVNTHCVYCAVKDLGNCMKYLAKGVLERFCDVEFPNTLIFSNKAVSKITKKLIAMRLA